MSVYLETEALEHSAAATIENHVTSSAFHKGGPVSSVHPIRAEEIRFSVRVS